MQKYVTIHAYWKTQSMPKCNKHGWLKCKKFAQNYLMKRREENKLHPGITNQGVALLISHIAKYRLPQLRLQRSASWHNKEVQLT